MHSPPVIFARASLEQEKFIGNCLKNSLWYSQEGNFKWCYELNELKKIEKIVLKKFLDDPKFTAKTSKKIRMLSQKMHIFSRRLSRLDPKNKDNGFLSKTYEIYCQILKELYFWGIFVELADVYYNFFSKLLKKELKRAIAKRNLDRNLGEDFSILTAPTEESFAKKQEKDFLRLVKQIIKSPRLKKIFETKKVEDIISGLRSDIFEKKLSQHLEKYCWVNYNYEGPATDRGSLIDLLKHATIVLKPEEKIKEIGRSFKEQRRKKQELVKKLKPDKFLKMILELAQEFPTLKMIRKESIFHVSYAIDKIREEIGRRWDITLNQCRCLLPEELIKALELNRVNKIELKAREKEVVYLMKNGQEKIYTGLVARKISEKFILKEKIEKVEQISGNVAQLGKALGAVKILKSQADIPKVKEGDILVAMATNPTFVPAMKKAAAIVTDMGGITCHAAIISRELGIPCIIGTKIATKVLKDGDLVEVDANKGIVRILKK